MKIDLLSLLAGCLTEEYDFYTVDQNGKIDNSGGLLIATLRKSYKVIVEKISLVALRT